MRVAFNVADTPTKVPTIGDNGYQGFYPRKEILPKGWKWSRRHGRVGQDGLVTQISRVPLMQSADKCSGVMARLVSQETHISVSFSGSSPPNSPHHSKPSHPGKHVEIYTENKSSVAVLGTMVSSTSSSSTSLVAREVSRTSKRCHVALTL